MLQILTVLCYVFSLEILNEDIKKIDGPLLNIKDLIERYKIFAICFNEKTGIEQKAIDKLNQEFFVALINALEVFVNDVEERSGKKVKTIQRVERYDINLLILQENIIWLANENNDLLQFDKNLLEKIIDFRDEKKILPFVCIVRHILLLELHQIYDCKRKIEVKVIDMHYTDELLDLDLDVVGYKKICTEDFCKKRVQSNVNTK